MNGAALRPFAGKAGSYKSAQPEGDTLPVGAGFAGEGLQSGPIKWNIQRA